MSCGIYHIICKNTGKRYVGSSKNIEVRWYRHKSQLRKNKHHSILLQRSFNKYGEDSLYYLIYEICEENILLEREDILIKEMCSVGIELNIKKEAIGGGNRTGMKNSAEHNEKISKAQKGIPRLHKKRTWNDEQKRKVSDFMKKRHIEGLVNRHKSQGMK